MFLRNSGSGYGKINQKNMYIYQKIQKTVKKHFTRGDLAKYKEIVNVVKKEYPEIKTNCILPNDLCDNWKNKDPKSGKHKIFHKRSDLGIGEYEVL
jgi:hypothetical protein